MLLQLTQVFFIWGIHGFLQLSWILLFATKWVLFHLLKNGLQEIFLSQLTQFSEEYNVLDATFLPCMVVFGELHAFPPLTWIGLLQQKVPISTLNHLIFGKYFFPKLTQLSKRNNVLLASASTQMDFLREIHVFLEERWIGGSAAKWAFSIWKTLVRRKYSFQKLSECHGITMCSRRQPLSQLVFFGEIHMVLQLRWIGLFGGNWGYVHLKRPWLQEGFFS
jgi:hypothetical protein